MPISPTDILDENDPGDETQRNFRYQHGYGAILLISSYVNSLPYISVWCEHHEDLLAETDSGTFDAYQVKTRKPENGEWTIVDEEMKKCLKRFVELYKKFGHQIGKFAIVSNVTFMTCDLNLKDQARVIKSLVRLLEAVTTCDNIHLLPTKFAGVFAGLVEEFGCTAEELHYVLKRTELVKGPSRDSFDTEISHSHLTKCPECRHFDFTNLNKIRDEVIQKVYAASSLKIDNSLEHIQSIQNPSQAKLNGKRLNVSVVRDCIHECNDYVFRYQPVDSSLTLTKGSTTHILAKKLEYGNLNSLIKTFNRRTISAEERLLEASYENPSTIESLLTQLESVVQAECDDAELEALLETGEKSHADFGPKKYLKVVQRLKAIADQRPDLVHSEPFETLIGIAGLLSENCSVWWSETFNLTDQP